MTNSKKRRIGSPFSHEWLASVLPEIHAPVTEFGWMLVAGAIPAVMVLADHTGLPEHLPDNWAAMHAVADVRTNCSPICRIFRSVFQSFQHRRPDCAHHQRHRSIVQHHRRRVRFVIKEPVTILALVGYQLTIQPKLTFISIIIFPICLVPAIIYGRKVRQVRPRRAGIQRGIEGNLMHESFTGNRVIKAYNLEDSVIAEFKATTRKYVGRFCASSARMKFPASSWNFSPPPASRWFSSMSIISRKTRCRRRGISFHSSWAWS